MTGKSEGIHFKIIFRVVLAGLCMLPFSAIAEDPDEWSYSVTPYLWQLVCQGKLALKVSRQMWI